MRTLKIIISVLAALLVSFASLAAAGAFAPAGLVLSAATVAILLAISQGAAVFGISVYQFQPPIPAYLSWAGGLMAIIQAGHAGNAAGTGTAHPVFWVVFGCLGVLISNLGKSPLPHQPAVPPAPPAPTVV